jgi:hypothetical protein
MQGTVHRSQGKKNVLELAYEDKLKKLNESGEAKKSKKPKKIGRIQLTFELKEIVDSQKLMLT